MKVIFSKTSCKDEAYMAIWYIAVLIRQGDVHFCELDIVLAAADGNAVAARKRLGTTTSVGSCKLT